MNVGSTSHYSKSPKFGRFPEAACSSSFSPISSNSCMLSSSTWQIGPSILTTLFRSSGNSMLHTFSRRGLPSTIDVAESVDILIFFPEGEAAASGCLSADASSSLCFSIFLTRRFLICAGSFMTLSCKALSARGVVTFSWFSA